MLASVSGFTRYLVKDLPRARTKLPTPIPLTHQSCIPHFLTYQTRESQSSIPGMKKSTLEF
jgi:hypothetical protein